MKSTPSVTEMIPEHLRPFIAKQDASLYTPIDHASWRYILRVSKAFFAKHAHQKYLDGLKETGIGTERIPLIDEMDARLRSFGWRAVPVSGFIPPAAFMEFQSLGILPIACEMRTLEHLAYTPAPDIVHEAAGHAPIIADREYAQYLRHYGEVARKAIFSSQDQALYEAIRELSDIKENPASTPEEIAAAEMRLEEANRSVTYISEAAYLARMNWWTVEYGLVGSLEEPKIYGAGLLSSVGESYNCLKPKVTKRPLTLACLEVSYDITRPQPQLFVTPDFATLAELIEEFAKTMAFRQGGTRGLEKAKQAKTVTTTELDSGLQISGVLMDFRADANGEPVFLRYAGPTQLAFNDLELKDQGPGYHREGYSTPIGRIQGIKKPASELSDADLKSLGFSEGRKGVLEFESGIQLTGILKATVRENGCNLILSFENCTVKHDKETLFLPEWGTFDLGCGENVVSVFGGAADRGKYLAATGGFEQKPQKPKSNLTRENAELNRLYAEVREIREAGDGGAEASTRLREIHALLEKSHPTDWLLRLELLELAKRFGLEAAWTGVARMRLKEIAATAQDRADMISRGLELL